MKNTTKYVGCAMVLNICIQTVFYRYTPTMTIAKHIFGDSLAKFLKNPTES